MKTLYKTILVLTVISIMLQSCKKFDDINTNPNSPIKTTASLLATNLILNITTASAAKTFIMPVLTSKQLSWGESPEAPQYNNFGSASFSGLSVLINVQKMIDAAAEGDKKAYTGLGLFIKAYKLYYLSLSVGDIPYAEALNAETGNVKPKYDTQKQVMQQVLRDLETSAASFSGAGNFSGDPIFNGNTDTWRRVVNSFRLKVLMSLSKKEADPDLRIKENFAKILQSEPLLRSNSDNLQLVYSDKANQLYPFNNTINKFVTYGMVSSVMIDTLRKYGDYRLFYYAAPSPFKLQSEGKIPADWDAYQGTDPSAEFTSVVNLFNAKKYSQLNIRYSAYAAGEPLIRIGYAEQNYIIAEAIVRGWAGGSAKTYYEDGIRTAMNFVASATPDDAKYHSDRKITSGYITDTYLKNDNVSFSSSPERQLKQIWIQKYLLYFMQHPYDAYYDYRRTGYPNLPVNPLTSTNPFDKNQIPVRYTYPSEEYSYNLENLKVALDRQYKGNDRTDGLMWILQ
ncbi:SusD/RagB family nutrient-binding outer membrane lipoprotein [Pedobacter sp. PAMC26386]|nr:SusD/RagB family nutrient-binding outer membrane lipoprotein [Pedobacter sp. PAMC26386]